MKETFDFDYLGKDLSGNAEIQSAVDRGIAFMKLEKWEKSLQVFDDLIDLHPESPCGWFGKARLVSKEFTLYGLESEEYRTLIAAAAESLDTAIKVVDTARKEDYIRLQATYSDYLKKNLINAYIHKMDGFIDSMYNLAETARKNMPSGVSVQNYVAFVLGNTWEEEIMKNKENTIYDIPEEILDETASEYVSLRLALLHKSVMEKFSFPALCAVSDRNLYFLTGGGSTVVAEKFLNDGGKANELKTTEQITRARDKYLPAYKYFKPEKKVAFTLASIIKDKQIFDESAKFDPEVKRVFISLFKLLKLLNASVGDLKDAGVPDSYLNEISAELQKEAEAEKERKEIQIKNEQAARKQKEKAEQEKRAQAAANARALKAEKRKKYFWLFLLIVCWGVGSLLWSAENLIALPLFGVGIICFFVYRRKRKKLRNR